MRSLGVCWFVLFAIVAISITGQTNNSLQFQVPNFENGSRSSSELILKANENDTQFDLIILAEEEDGDNQRSPRFLCFLPLRSKAKFDSSILHNRIGDKYRSPPQHQKKKYDYDIYKKKKFKGLTAKDYWYLHSAGYRKYRRKKQKKIKKLMKKLKLKRVIQQILWKKIERLEEKAPEEWTGWLG